MHNHVDRDRYIEVIWNNIQNDSKSNFDKVDRRKFGNFNTKYDFHSVMHYPKYAFSKNGDATIIARDTRFAHIMGQREYLSSGDAERINNMYKCFQ